MINEMTKSKTKSKTTKTTKRASTKNVDAKQQIFTTRDLQRVWKMSSTKNVRRILRSHDIRIGRGNEHKFDRATFNRHVKLYDVKS